MLDNVNEWRTVMKTRFSIFVLVSVLLMMASAIPAAAVEAPGVITNGSFEAPRLPNQSYFLYSKGERFNGWEVDAFYRVRTRL